MTSDSDSSLVIFWLFFMLVESESGLKSMILAAFGCEMKIGMKMCLAQIFTQFSLYAILKPALR